MAVPNLDEALGIYSERFPFIAWREPVTVIVGGLSGMCCRVCIGVNGLKGSELALRAFPDRAAFDSHMKVVHHAVADS